MTQWSTIRDRAAGKWQIPLLVISLLLLAGAIFRSKPSPTRASAEDALAQLDTLIDGKLYSQAVEYGDAVLDDPRRDDAVRASVHLRLARARYGEARANRTPFVDPGRRIFEHYQAASSYGQPLTGDDLKHMGRALEWQLRFAGAVECYNEAIEHGVDQTFELRKHALELARDRLGAPLDHLNDLLDGFLADLADHQLDMRLWAIEQKLEVLEALGRIEEASTLLARSRDDFTDTDLFGRFGYLEALLLYKTGYYDQAETHLRTIRNGLDRSDEVHAATGWLLGRVVLSDDGPQRPLEALSFFSDVMNFHQGTAYAVASRIGTAEARAMLGRHEEAINAYTIAIEELEALEAQRLVSRDVLRTSLGVVAEARRQEGQLRASLDYARLASALVELGNLEQATLYLELLGRAQSLLARHLKEQRAGEGEAGAPEPRVRQEEIRSLLSEAGATYLELARINTLNERRSADASWRAAELYGDAGERDRAAKLYEAFVVERPGNALVPRALLRVGQLRQQLGQWPEAIEAYQECYRRFPRTLDGSRTLTPLARCYLALGPGNEELAEKTLRVVLDDSEVFTPQAPEFAEALFLLGDVLNRREAFEQAITTLEEALERYSRDPRAFKARFWLADSYRRSGLAMKLELADAKFAGESEYMLAESTARLNRARTLYREVIGDYELRDPAGLALLEKLYLRHAYLYEADCFFEVRRYRNALKLYEEAAGAFKDTPSALAAFVQIINCHVFLGQTRDARAALARAVILVDAIPVGAFAETVSPQTRDDWRRYLDWLGESELF